MVREMLKPMLAQWLDRDLPAMVERLVMAEIARLKG
jgi:cell pole-organizing protein PopZ